MNKILLLLSIMNINNIQSFNTGMLFPSYSTYKKHLNKYQMLLNLPAQALAHDRKTIVNTEIEAMFSHCSNPFKIIPLMHTNRHSNQILFKYSEFSKKDNTQFKKQVEYLTSSDPKDEKKLELILKTPLMNTVLLDIHHIISRTISLRKTVKSILYCHSCPVERMLCSSDPLSEKEKSEILERAIDKIEKEATRRLQTLDANHYLIHCHSLISNIFENMQKERQ